VPGTVTRRPGGVAANVAIALARHGISARLVAAIGTDPDGDALAAALAAAGVEATALLRVPGATDRYVAIETAAGELHAAVADCRRLETAARALAGQVAALDGDLVVDGNLPTDAIAELVQTGRPVAAVAASPGKASHLAPALGAPNVTLYANRVEAGALCGAAFPDSLAAATAIVARGTGAALVTDGAGPAAWADARATACLAPPPVALRSATGAGDALIAAHIAALRRGAAPADALAAALAAAARHAARAA